MRRQNRPDRSAGKQSGVVDHPEKLLPAGFQIRGRLGNHKLITGFAARHGDIAQSGAVELGAPDFGTGPAAWES